MRPGGAVSVTYRVRCKNAVGGGESDVLVVVSTEKIPRGSAQAIRFVLPAAAVPHGEPQINPTNQVGTETAGGGETVGTSSAVQTQQTVTASLWTYPNDPILTSLGWASEVESVRDILAQAPYPGGREVGAQVRSLTPVVYRPTRRAVLRADGDNGPVAWVKVASAQRIEHLAATLHMLGPAPVPVPRVLGRPSADTIIQAHGYGYPLAQLIARDPFTAARMFPQIKYVLDQLPAQVTTLPRRSSWTDRRQHYAQAMVTLLPRLRPQVEELLAGIERLLVVNQPQVPVHGDFFEANLLTDGRGITTLLDLDSVGPGLRADDYACLLAHVSVLPFLRPDRWVAAPATEPWRSRLDLFLPGRRCRDYADSETVLEAWRLQAERECFARDLYARCAAVTLSLASSTPVKFGEEEALARFRRAQWWLQLAADYA